MCRKFLNKYINTRNWLNPLFIRDLSCAFGVYLDCEIHAGSDKYMVRARVSGFRPQVSDPRLHSRHAQVASRL